MAAEHMRPNGLSMGYYCMTCGGVCNMYATGHGDGKCEPNPDLVAALRSLNEGEIPNQFPYMRCPRLKGGLLGKREAHPFHMHRMGGRIWKCTGRFD